MSGPMTSTSTPTKSTPNNSEKKTTLQPTLGESIQRKYLTSISFVQDFLANRFHLRARGRVSKIHVERFSSRYAELRSLKDLHYYSSRMLKDSLTMTGEKLSRSSFNRWMKWGIGSNGRFLTANTSEFPRIGSVCSLSDILEEEVPDRYFLSSTMIRQLQKQMKSQMGRLLIPSPEATQADSMRVGTMFLYLNLQGPLREEDIVEDSTAT